MLFAAQFTELADDHFLTALAWVIAALQDANDPGCVLKFSAAHQVQLRIKRGLCLALDGALELLPAADWSILIFLPKFRIRIQGGSEFGAVAKEFGTQEAISSWSSLPK